MMMNYHRLTFQFIKGDISFAARQYWASTGDVKWLNGENYSFPLEVMMGYKQ